MFVLVISSQQQQQHTFCPLGQTTASTMDSSRTADGCTLSTLDSSHSRSKHISIISKITMNWIITYHCLERPQRSFNSALKKLMLAFGKVFWVINTNTLYVDAGSVKWEHLCVTFPPRALSGCFTDVYLFSLHHLHVALIRRLAVFLLPTWKKDKTWHSYSSYLNLWLIQLIHWDIYTQTSVCSAQCL